MYGKSRVEKRNPAYEKIEMSSNLAILMHWENNHFQL